MTSAFFGELSLRCSYGLNSNTRPAFIESSVLHASGNAVCENQQPVVVLDAHITAFAASQRPQAVIAFALSGSGAVFVATYPRGATLAVLDKHVPVDAEVTNVAFSFDGRFLAVTYSTPHFYLSVWDWEASRLVSKGTVPSARRCDFCLFNPFNSRQLCTTGDGLINLWALDVVTPEGHLWHTEGEALQWTNPDDVTDTKAIEPYMPCWSQEGQVFATTRDGSSIVVYDFITGDAELLLSANQPAFDGVIRWMEAANHFAVAKSHKCCKDVDYMSFSPDYRCILAVSRAGATSLTDLAGEDPTTLMELEQSAFVGVAFPALLNTPVTVTSDGSVAWWSSTNTAKLHSLRIPATLTCVGGHPIVSMIAVGSASGQVMLMSCHSELGFKPVKTFELGNAIVRVMFDPTGKYLCAQTSDHRAHFIDTMEHFMHIGYREEQSGILSLAWHVSQEDGGTHVRLFALVNDRQKTLSFIHRYEIPAPPVLLAAGYKMGEHLSMEALKGVVFVAGTMLHACAVCHINNGMEVSDVVYCLCDDHTVKGFMLPDKLAPDGTSPAAVQISGAVGHEKVGGGILFGPTLGWLMSYAADGMITYQSLPDLDRNLRIYAHDSLSGGVASLALSADGSIAASVGADGILNVWEWKYTDRGRELAASCKNATITKAEANKEVAQKLEERLRSLAAIKSVRREEELVQIEQKLKSIIEANERQADVAKLSADELLFDTEWNAQLLKESEQRIGQARREIEDGNIRRKVVCSRIRAECWDAMDVRGQSILSFNNDPVTCKVTEVRNYPIRRRSAAEQQHVDKMKLMRATQVLINRNVQEILQREGMGRADSSHQLQHTLKIPSAPVSDVPMPLSALLFHPYELTTNERKRAQVTLLTECIEELKCEFNSAFQDMVKAKATELSKVAERNERIKSILDELEIQENVYVPQLKDVEVPDRTIEVRDDEIKAQRYLSAEEQRKLEEKRRQDEERARLAQEDDSKQRALDVMMGGKLEEKTEKQEPEKLVRPEWMDKPASELSEEEKKLIKEFDKKVATKKEEMEKYRKSLEAELRKLQQSVQDLCAAFDDLLRKFFKKRTQTDSAIFQQELRIIKLEQSILFSEDDDTKHATVLLQMEKVKREKHLVNELLPGAKAALERIEELYEQTVRRDKDIEKQFKKEFHIHEFYYDLLYKLFKRRTDGTMDAALTAEDENDEWTQYSPYSDLEKTMLPSSRPVPDLSIESDLPEGLSTDIWQNLVAFRNRKVDSEREVKNAQFRLGETQTIVQTLMQRMERLNAEAEHLSGELSDFMEYRFLSMYNMDNLFELKQGQVEVAQAPVVTDYSSAALIDRHMVESVNERIVELGRQKVDALKEMKEYRKGIYTLQWENNVLDFQAEDLVIRTRDIQLLRVTKEMQEYLRSGDENMHSAQIAVLEKQADYNSHVASPAAITHQHKLQEVDKAERALRKKVMQKREENARLDMEIQKLSEALAERQQIQGGPKARSGAGSRRPDGKFRDIAQRRKVVDLARSQAHDLAILKEEVRRLKLKTYPAFAH
ncbi:hypothetical protein RI367_000287 [Sorochytrium milnesiophthora]